MNTVIYLLFISIFFFDFLYHELEVINRPMSLFPDIISVVVMAMIVFRVAATKTFPIHQKYVVLFGAFTLHVIIGIILNTVPPGAVFAGLRDYFRYVPFFLVPAVFAFSDEQIYKQLKFILCLLLLQFPLVIYQRFVLFAGRNTGDDISGTLIISSILSIVLICTMAVVFAFYLKKRIGLRTLLILLPFLFLPTTLNETKGTLFLLPLAVLVPVLVSGVVRKRPAFAVPVALAGAVSMIGFVTLYDMALGQTRERSIAESVTGEGLKNHLYKGATGDRPSVEKVGKVDSYMLAYRKLSDDTLQLGVGLGIGNVSESFSELFYGRFTKEYAKFGPDRTAMASLLWEIGIIGIILVCIGCYLVFDDTRCLSGSESLAGSLALGWTAVVVIYVVCLGYKNIITHNVIGYLFWYFSGYVAVSRLRWEQRRRDTY